MKSKDDIKDRDRAPVEINPIAFRRAGNQKASKTARVLKWSLSLALGIFLILLGVSLWFVFTARQVIIRIDPTPDRLSISGAMIAPKIGDDYLMRPGAYLLTAEKECYQPLREKLVVSREKAHNFEFSMAKQPGQLSFLAHQADAPAVALPGATIAIDGRQRGRTPLTGLEVKPGRRSLTVQAENYQTLQTAIEVAGCGEVQQFDLALVPGWAEITLQSEPAGAAVLVDGKSFGKTPATLKLPEGSHDLVIQADRFKPWQTRLQVVANQPQQLETVRLQPADGTLAVRSRPAGANVMVGPDFAGQTPLELTLEANKTHQLHLSKAGYEQATRTVKLLGEKSKTLSITLKPKLGLVNFKVTPADATLSIDGKTVGRVPPNLRLLAVEHQLEISKPGYRPYRTRLTPRPGFPQEIKIALSQLSSSPGTPAETITAKNGYKLKLVRAGIFSMGSSRREQGRRSNETLRKINLQRPFYIGVREVTNGEVRQFLAAHNSGAFKQQNLNLDALPAAGITWEQAALFCNWLSAKDSLPPVYVPKGGKLVAAAPVGNGYRLPTEAEWEYCARFNGSRAELKYPWGSSYPPPPDAGNFADASAKAFMTNFLASYNDGYAVSAPPAKFKKNALGLYDMGGNVAEWCHDFYSIYPYDAQKVYLDPMGPAAGRHHVIKGSSWMQAGISELRLSYRDYSDSQRPDLGFRISRYVK